MLLEVLPQLMAIAAPALRPVSQHLYSPQEQAAVRCGQCAGRLILGGQHMGLRLLVQHLCRIKSTLAGAGRLRQRRGAREHAAH